MRRAASPAWLWLVLAVLLPVACGERAPKPPTAPAAVTPTAPEAELPPPRPITGAALDISGHWYVLARDLPYEALHMTLWPTDTDGVWEGSWASFDWRGTESEDQLHRLSRATGIAAHRDGDRIVVAGRAPQIDESGRPNGDSGSWTLIVRAVGVPGEELRFRGKLAHSQLTGPEGVTAEVTRHFVPWTR